MHYLEPLDFIGLWPPSVLDLIFQHLQPMEVLESTLVSPTWNEYLSTQSLTCWKGITIQPKVSEQLELLANSDRAYQNLFAVNISTIVPQLIDIVTNPRRKWKAVAIFRTIFESRDQVEAILQKAAKTVERLEFHSISCKLIPEAKKSVKFPKLSSLSISNHFLDEGPCWLNGLFAATDNLETLHLSHACDVRMKELVLSATKLKYLSLSGKFEDENFFQDLAMKLPSRLEVFEFNDILSSSREDQNLSHFNNFFKSQGKTLRKFETDALLELDELESAFTMPNLHTLNFRGFHYNHDIVHGYLEQLRASQDTLPETRLKVVNTQRMDQNLLEILAINARGLQVLCAAELMATDASNPAWFPKLETIQVFILERELDKQIREKAENERSRLERMIIAAIDE